MADGTRIVEQNLRANVFTRDKDGKLRIPKGLHVRMFNADELTITFTETSGATGVAFNSGGLVIALIGQQKAYFAEGGHLFPVGGWRPFVIDPNEAAKIDKDLAWVFSAPITTDNGERIVVLDVDCIGTGCDKVTWAELADC